MVLRAETGHPACPLRGRPCPFTRKSVTYLLQLGLDSIGYKVILHSTTKGERCEPDPDGHPEADVADRKLREDADQARLP